MIEDKFPQYIGREVSVVETLLEYRGKQFSNLDLDDNDTTIQEIEKDFDDFIVRVWLPGSAGTMELRPNRINVVVEKQDNGLYLINRLYVG